LSQLVWEIVSNWDNFSKNTVGIQLIRSADSVGANIAEGSGKGTSLDYRRYLKISRASLFETKHWLNLAYKRNLISEESKDELKIIMEILLPKLSAYINYIDSKI
jgi:four helix bundle protein